MRACWLKWVGRDWSISADYIWLNYSDANTPSGIKMNVDGEVGLINHTNWFSSQIPLKHSFTV